MGSLCLGFLSLPCWHWISTLCRLDGHIKTITRGHRYSFAIAVTRPSTPQREKYETRMISRGAFSTHPHTCIYHTGTESRRTRSGEIVFRSTIGGKQYALVSAGVVRAAGVAQASARKVQVPVGKPQVSPEIEYLPPSTSAYPVSRLPGFAGGRGGSPNRPPLVGKWVSGTSAVHRKCPSLPLFSNAGRVQVPPVRG